MDLSVSQPDKINISDTFFDQNILNSIVFSNEFDLSMVRLMLHMDAITGENKLGLGIKKTDRRSCLY